MAWPNGQTRVVSLTVQNAQVSGSGTRSHFPVLALRVNLPDEMCSPTDGNRAQADGGDIRAALNSNGTGQIPLEIVAYEYDTSDGAGDAHTKILVKINLNTANDTVFYLAYNTPGTTAADARTATFGSDNVYNSNYVGVYHLDDAESDGLNDATSNNRDLTNNGATAITTSGLGGGYEFDGINDYMTGNYIPVTGSTARSVSLLGKIDVLNIDYVFTTWGSSSTGAAGFRWEFRADDDTGNSRVRTEVNSGFEYGDTNLGTSLAHYASDLTGTNVTDTVHYIDGVAEGVGASASRAVSTGFTANLAVGARNITGTPELHLNGTLEELRISNVSRGADWLKTESNNLGNPALFIVEGVPQPIVPPVGGFPPIMYKGVNLGSTGIR